ncbi:DUF1311 domain-containing protein [Rugamonas sp. FT103W]|uniref:DUF1311 domain-containing protein n=1 Tax=Rugamonas rivuli TaxID=2743358 RepID=A0A843S1L6_9BURK|nr:DUF1311 domain-containing protein [Rugamonas rivuli]
MRCPMNRKYCLPMKSSLKLLTLATVLLHANLAVSGCKDNCVLKNRSQDQHCSLDNTPLTRCEKFPAYIAEDGKLNAQYKNLIKILNGKDASALRTTQRAWLQWRLDKCDDMEELSKCDNGVCAGVAHDACIVALTRYRTADFVKFENDPVSAVRANFSFSPPITNLPDGTTSR